MRKSEEEADFSPVASSSRAHKKKIIIKKTGKSGEKLIFYLRAVTNSALRPFIF